MENWSGTVVVIGAGVMGAGIAQVAAQSGFPVILVDQSANALKKAPETINWGVKQWVSKQKGITNPVETTDLILGRIQTSTNTLGAVSKAGLVIEAISENLEMKQKLFASIEANVARSCILATNTSFLRLQDISSRMKDKSRFGGLHFFNPVPVMALVEVVKSPETSQETLTFLRSFTKKLGKSPVVCKDTPGFIVNRLLSPYLKEAMAMAERGDASYQDIDTAMKLGANYIIGPFELADLIGLDVFQAVLKASTPNARKNGLVQDLVAKGKLGRKSGEGFYKYHSKL